MPKATAYTLAWSVTHQAYTLYDRHAEATLEFDETSLAWHAWLEQASSFAFRGQKGAYTARREQIKPGDWYWYAYQRSQKRVQKKYLGKSAAISLQRLEEVAASFNSEQAVEDETAISTRPVRMSNMAQERIWRQSCAFHSRRDTSLHARVSQRISRGRLKVLSHCFLPLRDRAKAHL